MIGYTLRRLLTAIPTLWLLVTLAFFLIRLTPGGPFDGERALPPEVEQNLRQIYNLDESLPVQYGRYLWQILRLDFGPSFHYRDWTVNQLIADGLPTSLALGGLALAVALVFGLFFGVQAALHQNRPTDHALMGIAMIGISVPNFVMAPLLILVLAIGLGLLPAGGWDWRPTQMVLPVITLALPLIAYLSRLTRGAMIEVLHSPFIRMARAKGLPRRHIIVRHAFKPSLLPVISFLGPAAAAVLTGSVVIERIFTIPGLGNQFVQAALNRDYTLVMGIVVVYGMLIIAFNLLVDLLYAWLDPKIRLRRQGEL